jgi:uncharacterized membrane protein
MDPALVLLLAACTAFVGSHLIMSHPLRGPMVKALGDKGFLGVYSLISLAAFVWMVLAFRAASPGGGGVPGLAGEAEWALASILTLIASVLLIGSFKGNPAMPDTPAERIAAATPHGVFLVTRHPMLWSFVLWALAHMILSWSQRTSILAAAILILSLAGSYLQDRKKEALLGDAWKRWEAQTSNLPRFGALMKVPPVQWLAGLVLWLAATWAHIWVAGIAAGAWHWIP